MDNLRMIPEDEAASARALENHQRILELKKRNSKEFYHLPVLNVQSVGDSNANDQQS